METRRYFKKSTIGLFKFVMVLLVLAIVNLFGRYESISAQVDVPKVVTKDGQDTLLLPDKLLESIKTNFPGFRVPTSADVTGPWKIEKKPGLFPFIIWGDFNGDGFIDVATIMITSMEWKFVIFNKNKEQEYIPAYRIEGKIRKEGADIQYPQEILLEILPASVEKTVEFVDGTISYEQKTVLKYKFKFDAIEFHLFEKGMSFIYWENGNYKSVDIGSL